MITIKEKNKKQKVFFKNKYIGELYNFEFLNINNLKITTSTYKAEISPFSGKLIILDIDEQEILISNIEYDINEPYLGLNSTFIRILGQLI